MIKIEYLSDFPEFAETVAGWLYEEFVVGQRAGVTYENVLRNVKNTNKAALPIRLIAIFEDSCVGTISIVYNDLRCRTYTPWLASLYVSPPYRKNKIGEQLVKRVIEIVKSLGYGELYLRTEYTGNYYRNRNWQYVETCMDDVYQFETEVFMLHL